MKCKPCLASDFYFVTSLLSCTQMRSTSIQIRLSFRKIAFSFAYKLVKFHKCFHTSLILLNSPSVRPFLHVLCPQYSLLLYHIWYYQLLLNVLCVFKITCISFWLRLHQSLTSPFLSLLYILEPSVPRIASLCFHFTYILKFLLPKYILFLLITCFYFPGFCMHSRLKRFEARIHIQKRTYGFRFQGPGSPHSVVFISISRPYPAKSMTLYFIIVE